MNAAHSPVRHSVRRAPLVIFLWVAILCASAAAQEWLPLVMSMEFQKAPPPAPHVLMPTAVGFLDNETLAPAEAENRIVPPPKIDGKLDDKCWRDAAWAKCWPSRTADRSRCRFDQPSRRHSRA